MFKSAIAKGAGIAGGLYVARGYLRDRLEEVREKMELERVARDNLRRRFEQTQEDTSFTILALLPTLSEQILQTMDVDALTKELQARSRARNAVLSSAHIPSVLEPTPSYQHVQHPQPHLERPPSSLASSVDIITPITSQEDDTRSEVDSVALSHTSDEHGASRSNLSDSFTAASASVTQSWVDSSGSRNVHSPAPSGSAASSIPELSEEHVLVERQSYSGSGAGQDALSESIMSSVTSATTSSAVSESSDARSKAELWNEVKMLAVTRTLTTLYSTTLLCLFTTLQLTLLARSKYVSSVLQQEREERLREQFEAQLSVTNMLFSSLGFNSGATAGLEKLLSGIGLDGEGNDEGRDGGLWSVDGINEEVESKYLTMSWWLLHVGWKDVGERVRRGVEEVFDGVSLKTKLAAIDLHRLISDVRRRVEHEITFEGTERRTNFLSSLLPPTPETIHHVLTQGGYTSSSFHPHQYHPSSALESSLSLDSSQISYNFVNSPALAIATQPQQPYASYLPPPQHAHLLDEPFASLIAETRDILASADFARVLEVCLDQATEVLFDGLEKNVFGPSGSLNGEEVVRIRLAGLLPGLAKWSQLALDGMPNELVDKMLNLREVSCLSAITFARFEEHFQ